MTRRDTYGHTLSCMQVGKHLDMLHEISQKCDMYGFLDPGATHASMHEAPHKARPAVATA